MAAIKPGLASLIAPHKAADFMAQCWPGQPFVAHGLKKTVQPLTEIPLLQSLDTLLNSWPTLIQAHLPDVRDEASRVEVNAADARKLFSNQMGLLFNRAHLFSPMLAQWLQALQADLGLPAMTDARCMIYATPDGKGTAPHFDQNINFVLQVHGEKTWWVAPNEHVVNPTQRHTMGLETDPELASYAQKPMPTKMPKKAVKYVLKPGSLLFVPRGYWHSTEAKGEALALNFTFSQPTWVDLFTAALRSRLVLSPEWRELADGVSSSNEALRDAAAFKFDELLLELTHDLPNWRAEDILGATEA